jgi:hypothetical protein
MEDIVWGNKKHELGLARLRLSGAAVVIAPIN